jgi:O-acetyl-ADP-ribose deacetylase (regulator of RNase III)
VGNLRNKKKIFHTVLPTWDSNDNQKSSEKVKKIIKSLLDEAINNNFESICFPALGTGNLKYSIHFIPNLMFQAFNEYFSSVKNSTLKKVFIVIYDKDTEVIKAFKSYQGDFSQDGGINNFYSDFVSSTNGFSLNFGNQISVNVYSGDITKSNADVIFNPTSSTLEMGGNVSKALLNGGGANLLNEIKSQKINNLNGFCLTSGGDLKCKSIIHFDVRSFDIKTTVVLTLRALNEKNFKSIDFPVIGTGQVNSKPQNCIEEMINGISTYAVIMQHSNKSPGLTQINICVHTAQQEFLKYFSDSFSNLNEKKHVDSSFLNKISQFMQKIEPNFDGKTIKIERPAENSGDLLRIIADSKDKIVKVKSEIERLASLEVMKHEFKCNVLKLDQATKISIENICKRTKASYMWGNDRIYLSGRRINVPNCVNSILTAVLTAQKVRWEYLKNDTWFPFDLSMNNEIEHLFTDNINDQEITNENNVSFVFDLKNMVQSEKLNRHKQSNIRRINLEDLKVSLNLPNHWLSNNYENIIDLKNTDQEYTDVYKLFKDTGGTGFIKKVLSIHRIQNKRLYIQYQTQKEQFEKIATSKSNEMRLFHGTSHDCVQKIWSNGFDRNYAGKLGIFSINYFLKCKNLHMYSF